MLTDAKRGANASTSRAESPITHILVLTTCRDCEYIVFTWGGGSVSVEGDWSVVSGAFFPVAPEMSRHVIAPRSLPVHWD